MLHASSVQVREYELSESDRFVLLASDGLWECCSDEEVTEVLQAAIMSIDQNRFRQVRLFIPLNTRPLVL